MLAQDIRSQALRHVNSCYFTMVAVDDDRKPSAVPPLQPGTPDEKRRFEAARVRRALRDEMRERFAALKQAMP